MSQRVYGQFCGFARALEVVGERWALLIVRDLVIAPKRFSDLLRGLPGIPTNILTARLKELEVAAVVRRRVLAAPERSVVYELTAYGRELEPTLVALSRWGAKQLVDPRPGEIVTPDSMMMALRTTFRPETARGVRRGYELRFGELVVRVRIADGTVDVGLGTIANADLVIDAGMVALRPLLAREFTPAHALAEGLVHIVGKPKLFDDFVSYFRIDPMPAQA